MDETVDNSLETVDDVVVGVNPPSGARKVSVGTALLAGSVYSYKSISCLFSIANAMSPFIISLISFDTSLCFPTNF